MQHGHLSPSGRLSIRVARAPKVGLGWKLANLPNLWRGWWRHAVAETLGISHLYGTLHARVIRADGTVLDYGLVSTRVVTDAGVAYLVDALQGTVEPELLRYHGLGTGVTAEAVGQTALVTELTTEYAVNNTRPQGTLAESAANIFQSVGTNTVDGAAVIREHGLFSANAAGTLLDRSLFAAISLEIGDSLVTTYSLTIASGS